MLLSAVLLEALIECHMFGAGRGLLKAVQEVGIVESWPRLAAGDGADVVTLVETVHPLSLRHRLEDGQSFGLSMLQVI